MYGGSHKSGCDGRCAGCIVASWRWTWSYRGFEVGDVVLADFPGQGGEVEAKVVRDIDRTDSTVRVTLRADGYDEFIKEWPLGHDGHRRARSLGRGPRGSLEPRVSIDADIDLDGGLDRRLHAPPDGAPVATKTSAGRLSVDVGPRVVRLIREQQLRGNPTPTATQLRAPVNGARLRGRDGPRGHVVGLSGRRSVGWTWDGRQMGLDLDARKNDEGPAGAGLSRGADDGTRTHDLLHGKRVREVLRVGRMGLVFSH